ncbi:hypothetical protein [Cyclobacterium xiamenense]|uniref:hypothetical protein n=1 Tax=Cyclobacterium xiamenense TaxID=1297121 RepID=UPI0035CFA8E8
MKKYCISTTFTLSSISYRFGRITHEIENHNLKKSTLQTKGGPLRKAGCYQELPDQPRTKPLKQAGVSRTHRIATDATSTECTEITPLLKNGTKVPSTAAEATPPAIRAGSTRKINVRDKRTNAIHPICWTRYFHLHLRQGFSTPAGNNLVSQKQWWKTPRTFTLSLAGTLDWE